VCSQIENNPEQKKLQKTLGLFFCISYRFTNKKKTLELLVKKGTIEERPSFIKGRHHRLTSALKPGFWHFGQ